MNKLMKQSSANFIEIFITVCISLMVALPTFNVTVTFVFNHSSLSKLPKSFKLVFMEAYKIQFLFTFILL